ncbi:MAG TPA: hypothetical protein VGI70_01015, partial [Polyangiales bacterium]
MATHVIHRPLVQPETTPLYGASSVRYAVPIGRVLFALIFLFAAPMHFTSQSIHYAAAQGVPLASIAVPLSG